MVVIPKLYYQYPMHFQQNQSFISLSFFIKYHYFSTSSRLTIVHFGNQQYVLINFQQDLCYG